MRFLAVFFSVFFSTISLANLDDGMYAKMQTSKGEILLELFFEKTPLTVINFAGLAEGTKNNNHKNNEPFYDGLTFHRVINDFMIQGGDPNGNGTGGPGYQFADEITDLKHDSAGILSMANSGADTNGSQFFITHKDTSWLNGKHTVFGKVVDGMDVVNQIEQGDTIKTLRILRVGDKAKGFQTTEQAFRNAQNRIQEQKSLKKLNIVKTLVDDRFPSAKLSHDGFYYEILEQGSGTKPNAGDKVELDLEVELDFGMKIRTGEPAIVFAAGEEKYRPVISNTVKDMKPGETRRVIATFEDVYGDKKGDLLLILTMKLISVK